MFLLVFPAVHGLTRFRFICVQIRGLTGQDQIDVRELEHSHRPACRVERDLRHDTREPARGYA